MNGLTSGKLADTLLGQLTLGTMPPLGGEWEPVRRVVFESASVERGDVYWDLAEGGTSSQFTGVAEEAFARGAVGVVSCRYIEPWAGAFSIQVSDAHRALERLAQWVIVRSKRRRLLIVDQSHSLLRSFMQLVIAGDVNAPVCRSVDEVAMQTIIAGISTGWHSIAVAANTDEHLGRVSDLCAPRVAVITSAAVGRMDVPSLLEALPQRGLALLASNEARLPPRENDSKNVVYVEANCDSVRCSCSEQGQWNVTFGNQRIALPTGDEQSMQELRLAVVVSQQLGFRMPRIADACLKVWDFHDTRDHQLNTTRTCKVLPLVSGLRESDAALPPGLKRWAC